MITDLPIKPKIKLNQIITSNLLKNYNNDITIHQLNIT